MSERASWMSAPRGALGRQVGCRARHRRCGLGRTSAASRRCEAQVDQHRAAVARPHHVGGLDVAVDDALSSQVVECLGDLEHDAQRLVLGQRLALGQALAQNLAAHLLQDADQRAAPAHRPERAQDVRVIEALEELELLDEPAAQRLVLDQLRTQDLERDRLECLGHPSGIDPRAAPLAQQAVDQVAGDLGQRGAAPAPQVLDLRDPESQRAGDQRIAGLAALDSRRELARVLGGQSAPTRQGGEELEIARRHRLPKYPLPGPGPPLEPRAPPAARPPAEPRPAAVRGPRPGSRRRGCPPARGRSGPPGRGEPSLHLRRRARSARDRPGPEFGALGGPDPAGHRRPVPADGCAYWHRLGQTSRRPVGRAVQSGIRSSFKAGPSPPARRCARGTNRLAASLSAGRPAPRARRPRAP